MLDEAGCLPLYAKLSDRFGDHGLIGIVVARPEEDDFAITDWLMSCRVLSRGVEQFLMNLVFDEARRRGLNRVTGQYIPTPKNGMVRDFFAGFGFRRTSEGSGGATNWALPVNEYQPREVFISQWMTKSSNAD